MRTMTRSISIFWIMSSSTILLSDGYFVQRPTTTTTTSTSTLLMAKNSDRAHLERNLEQMMGDDWRLFRAKLIAQEAIEADSASTTSTTNNKKAESTSNSNTKSSSNNHNNADEKSKHSQLSDLFAGAINSIFHNNDNNTNKNKSKVLNNKEGSIFDGDNIGGASSSYDRRHYDFDSVDSSSKFLSSLCSSSPTSSSSSTTNNVDPFVTVEELPCHMNPTITNVNKHRWAHEISHIETGCVLIANEKLGGVFHQTIVLIVQHNDKAGSIGIVINRYVYIFGLFENSLYNIFSSLQIKVTFLFLTLHIFLFLSFFLQTNGRYIT